MPGPAGGSGSGGSRAPPTANAVMAPWMDRVKQLEQEVQRRKDVEERLTAVLVRCEEALQESREHAVQLEEDNAKLRSAVKPPANALEASRSISPQRRMQSGSIRSVVDTQPGTHGSPDRENASLAQQLHAERLAWADEKVKLMVRLRQLQQQALAQPQAATSPATPAAQQLTPTSSTLFIEAAPLKVFNEPPVGKGAGADADVVQRQSTPVQTDLPLEVTQARVAVPDTAEHERQLQDAQGRADHARALAVHYRNRAVHATRVKNGVLELARAYAALRRHVDVRRHERRVLNLQSMQTVPAGPDVAVSATHSRLSVPGRNMSVSNPSSVPLFVSMPTEQTSYPPGFAAPTPGVSPGASPVAPPESMNQSSTSSPTQLPGAGEHGRHPQHIAADEHHAATKVQALYRGHAGRKHALARKQHQAATRIQARQRGNAARRRLKEEPAAVKIQALQRGRAARREVAAKRAAQPHNIAALLGMALLTQAETADGVQSPGRQAKRDVNIQNHLSLVASAGAWEEVKACFGMQFADVYHGDVVRAIVTEVSPKELAACNAILAEIGVDLFAGTRRTAAGTAALAPSEVAAVLNASLVHCDADGVFTALGSVGSQSEWIMVCNDFRSLYPSRYGGDVRAGLRNALCKADVSACVRDLKLRGVTMFDALPPLPRPPRAVAGGLRDAIDAYEHARNASMTSIGVGGAGDQSAASGVSTGAQEQAALQIYQHLAEVESQAHWDGVVDSFRAGHPDCHNGAVTRALVDVLTPRELVRCETLLSDHGVNLLGKTLLASSAQYTSNIAQALHSAVSASPIDARAVHDNLRLVRDPSHWSSIANVYKALYPSFYSGDLVACLFTDPQRVLTDDEARACGDVLREKGISVEIAGPADQSSGSGVAVAGADVSVARAATSMGGSSWPAPPPHVAGTASSSSVRRASSRSGGGGADASAAALSARSAAAADASHAQTPLNASSAGARPATIAAGLHEVLRPDRTVPPHTLYEHIGLVQDAAHWLEVERAFATMYPDTAKGSVVLAMQHRLHADDYRACEALLRARGTALVADMVGGRVTADEQPQPQPQQYPPHYSGGGSWAADDVNGSGSATAHQGAVSHPHTHANAFRDTHMSTAEDVAAYQEGYLAGLQEISLSSPHSPPVSRVLPPYGEGGVAARPRSSVPPAQGPVAAAASNPVSAGTAPSSFASSAWDAAPAAQPSVDSTVWGTTSPRPRASITSPEPIGRSFVTHAEGAGAVAAPASGAPASPSASRRSTGAASSVPPVGRSTSTATAVRRSDDVTSPPQDPPAQERRRDVSPRRHRLRNAVSPPRQDDGVGSVSVGAAQPQQQPPSQTSSRASATAAAPAPATGTRRNSTHTASPATTARRTGSMRRVPASQVATPASHATPTPTSTFHSRGAGAATPSSVRAGRGAPTSTSATRTGSRPRGASSGRPRRAEGAVATPIAATTPRTVAPPRLGDAASAPRSAAASVAQSYREEIDSLQSYLHSPSAKMRVTEADAFLQESQNINKSLGWQANRLKLLQQTMRFADAGAAGGAASPAGHPYSPR